MRSSSASKVEVQLGISPNLAIISAGVGNVVSLSSMLMRIGVVHEIIDDASRLAKYDKVILAGVGNFGAFVNSLADRGFVAPLRDYVRNPNTSILGVCVGAQALFGSSEEAPKTEGLGLVEGHVRKISPKESRHIPRIGWDYLAISDPHREIESFPRDLLAKKNRYFFSHSFCIDPADSTIVIAFSRSAPTIPAMFRARNVLGVQFHPERSGRFGSEFLKNFAEGRFDAPQNNPHDLD